MSKKIKKIPYKLKLVLLLICVLGGVLGIIQISSSRMYHSSSYLTFSSSNIPLVEIDIEDNNYIVGVDLGSTRPLELDQNVLSKLTKQRYGTAKWYNFKGHLYQAPSYVIPKIRLGSIFFPEVVTNEINLICEKDNQFQGRGVERSSFVGLIGNFLAKKKNILFDFPNARMFISNDWDKMQKEGYYLEKMVKVPLENSPEIVIMAQTCFGKKKFMIDTGATLSYVKPAITSQTDFSSYLLLENNDFGCVNFGTLEITSHFGDIDGIIGMNFLQNNVIYIDFSNKFLYIEK